MQISLLPGQSATFSSTSTDTVPNPDCPTAFTGTTLQVYPPGQTTPIRQPYSGSFCDLTVGPLQAIPRCHTSDLSPALTWIGAAAGNLGFVLYLANRSPTTCQVYGYVGMQLLDASRQPMETQVVRGSSMIFHDPGPTYIILEPGRVASAGIGFTDVPTGTNPSPCPTSTYVEITPPDETTYIIIQGSLGPCDGGTLDVTALQAGDHPRGPG